MDQFHSHINLLVKKILVRLKKYITVRIPTDRIDLMPGKHWVWSSFASKLKKIAAIMILSYHITDYDDLMTRTDEEDLFSKAILFNSVDKMIANSLSSDFDLIFQWSVGQIAVKRCMSCAVWRGVPVFG